MLIVLSENAPAAEAPAAEAAPAEAAETPAEAPKEEKVCVFPLPICGFSKFLSYPLQKEEKKEEKPKSPKVGRRLSARVGDFFKPKAKAEPTTPKVEENPPKLAESEPIAPLENPAAETAAAESTPAPAATEEPKTEAPPAAPVVAAAA